MAETKLITMAQYQRLGAKEKGYIAYMQGALPGSQLRGLPNPYVAGSKEHGQWNAGQTMGVLQAQDSEG